MTTKRDEFEPQEEDLDYSQYNRFNLPMSFRPLYPTDLNKYPFVIASNEERAIIALSPKRGFIIHKDGARGSTENLQELCNSTPDIPLGPYRWAKELLAKMIKDDTLKD
ncbi:MAG: hypothetical protein LBP59_11125 [Planctomycetaceae bacterium]|jgi:hypothetical protein|nr:hypothetical protein [Planctomycetaceae bacterium]